jgi:hypothetical protein
MIHQDRHGRISSEISFRPLVAPPGTADHHNKQYDSWQGDAEKNGNALSDFLRIAPSAAINAIMESAQLHGH